MLHTLLDLVFPRRSLTGGGSAWITDDERRQLQSRPVILDTAALRAQGLEFVDRIVATADYDSVPLLHRAIHAFKYKKMRGVGEVLGGMLVEVSQLLGNSQFPVSNTQRSPGSCELETACHERGRMVSFPVLCPVPLHWIRRFSRGFNQAELLADEVGRRRGWEIQNLLKRTRWTGSQVGRHRKERLVGVKDAFAIQSGMKIPIHVILVDDLSTTGATMNECAKVLKNAGVKNAEGLVLALG